MLTCGLLLVAGTRGAAEGVVDADSTAGRPVDATPVAEAVLDQRAAQSPPDRQPIAAAPAPGAEPAAPGAGGEPAAPSPAGEPAAPVAAEVDCAVLQCVALTFDDGPGPYTAELLAQLRAADVRATFFVTGVNAAARPDLIAQAAADGHAIGNHTWSHPDLTTLAPDGIADQLDRTAAALAAAGVTSGLMRPPYGATGPGVAAVTADRGLAQILWDVDTEDWRNRDVDVTTQRALDGAHAGAIVLMHDIHPTTVQAVPGTTEALQARGLTLVTVPQLLGPDALPGAVYRSR